MPTRAPSGLRYLVGRRVAQLRQARGLTQEAFASALDLATKNLQRIESGRQNLTLATLERIASALDVRPEALLAPPARLDAPRSSAEEESTFGPLRRLGFGVVPWTAEARQPRGTIPLVGLEVAAGIPGDTRGASVVAWLRLPKGRKAGPGWFVSRVVGDSMEPLIPNGAMCLFRPPTGPFPVGRVVLARFTGKGDPDTGASYAVKRLLVVDRRADGRIRIVLGSENHRYAQRQLLARTDEDFLLVAELDAVL